MSHGVIVRGATGGSLVLLLLGALAGPAQADELDVQSPSSDADGEQWYAWADDAVQDAEAVDWAAMAAQDGCTLVDVEVSEVVDPELNEALGAPADLAVPVVEREEDCSGPVSLTSDQAFSDQQNLDSTMAASSGACSTTSGPGTLCLARSGSYVTTSFRYNGSGTITAFLKLYDTGTCGKSPALATGGVYSYSNGTRRSLSVYSPGYDGYTSHIWKYVGLGVYTDWGSVCDSL